MTNSRVFWLVRGIKQRVGHGSTSPAAQAVFGELGGTSECVGFFQCRCASMQGRAACSGVGLHLGDSLTLGEFGGSSRCGTPAGSWRGSPALVTPQKCCNHNKPAMADGFLYRALTTVLN